MEPIRYVESVGGYSIAYQVVGDGPLDLIFVHGFICSFQPGWEWPALASFYRGLPRFGRLILFDKRGTGLSDRVLGIASLEERMDDVRAVMDAVGSERAVVVGVSEGGPMCALFAATHPDRTQALITLGAYARRNWAPDYPIGRRRSRTAGCARRPSSGAATRPSASCRSARRRSPPTRPRSTGTRPTSSRGASPAAVAAITDMNEEIDVRHVLACVRVPTLVLYREHEYLREASRYMGARLPGAQVVELPGADHLPWEGDQAARAGRDRAVPRRAARRAGRAEPLLTTVLDADLPAAEQGCCARRSRASAGAARRAARPHPRELRRPRPRRALRVRAGRHRPAAAGRRPHGRVRAARRHGSAGPALEIAAGVARAAPGEILATSTVQDLVAGSGIEFADNSGTLALRCAGALC